MKPYYISQYTNVIELDESALLFNGINGCIDEVSRTLADVFKCGVIDAGNQMMTQGELDFLLKRGHLTTLDPLSEQASFRKLVEKMDYKNLEESKKKGSIMLLLSYDCNLECYYCYQKQVRECKESLSMTPDIVDSLFNEHFSELFPNVSKNNLDITLYGGEPFLKMNRETIERTLVYAERYGLYTGAISNCTQIDYFYDLLGPLPGMVNFVQVSFDGDKENHDTSRIPTSKAPTFEIIINNIHELLKRKVKVNIRINVEANSLGQVDSLYQRLSDEEILHHPYAYVYVHPLHNHFNQTDDQFFMDHEKTARELDRISQIWHVRHPIRRKAEGMRYLFELQKGIPFSKTRFCMQNYPNNYVVDPFGDFYGCYEEAGREAFKIGTLMKDSVAYNPLRSVYLERTILNMDKCMKCPVALLCGGECGVQSREETGDIFDPYCGSRIVEIHEAIRMLYKEKYESTSIDSINNLYPNL